MIQLIKKTDSVFELYTDNTVYIFQVLKTGQLENLYYGKKIKVLNVEPLREKRGSAYCDSVIYSKDDPILCLDNVCLEYSGAGKGDFRVPSYEIELSDSSFVLDFKYEDFKIYKGTVCEEELPFAEGSKDEAETLEITLKDTVKGIYLVLYYTVFHSSDVITRKVKLINKSKEEIKVKRLMSLSLDLQNDEYSLITFDGAWAREFGRNEKKLLPGIYENSSSTGSSSDRHNPFFMLKRGNACETQGEVYGFNLVYSGNHSGIIEINPYGKLRVTDGINPLNFSCKLKPQEEFKTPEGVMCFSNEGFEGLSARLHDFVRNHIVRGEWKYKERPVLLNNWEGTYFNFNEDKLISMAQKAKELGIELFVLDDGWFGKRDDSRSSLGDWKENRKKLPSGIKGLAEKIKAMGLMFGLWFEPEMISRDSDLFRLHPDFAVSIPGRVPSEGRNQLVLDLTREDVRDYVVKSVCSVIDSAPIDYIKWDMNRQMSDFYSLRLTDGRQGEFQHRYILGLYDILRKICGRYPHILFESCSSGGNRFDLGMMTFMPQTWASDDTDAYERMYIQEGISYGYPCSVMGAHVSNIPNEETLRSTSLETRFNAASFGLLGYELDPDALSDDEISTIKEQIKFYKKHRKTFQFGEFKRIKSIYSRNKAVWMVISQDKKEAMLIDFQKLYRTNPSEDMFKVRGIHPDKIYKVVKRPQRIPPESMGSLLNQALRAAGNDEDSNGCSKDVEGRYVIRTNREEYTAYGDLLMEAGIRQMQQFSGAGYNRNIRFMNDFSSGMYVFTEIQP